MAILRNRTQNFTIVENVAVRDNRLSLKALGLLCKMLSLPDNWDFSEKGLSAIIEKDGLTSIRGGLKELEDAGYLHREQVRDERGAFKGWVWEISNTPQENPRLENQSSGNASSDFKPNKALTDKALCEQSLVSNPVRYREETKEHAGSYQALAFTGDDFGGARSEKRAGEFRSIADLAAEVMSMGIGGIA